jgi:hypothetical protein
MTPCRWVSEAKTCWVTNITNKVTALDRVIWYIDTYLALYVVSIIVHMECNCRNLHLKIGTSFVFAPGLWFAGGEQYSNKCWNSGCSYSVGGRLLQCNKGPVLRHPTILFQLAVSTKSKAQYVVKGHVFNRGRNHLFFFVPNKILHVTWKMKESNGSIKSILQGLSSCRLPSRQLETFMRITATSEYFMKATVENCAGVQLCTLHPDSSNKWDTIWICEAFSYCLLCRNLQKIIKKNYKNSRRI